MNQKRNLIYKWKEKPQKKESEMQTKIFALKDTKIGQYHNPFVQASEVTAIRGLEQALKNPDNQIAQYPSDFDLYEIGEFNLETGILIPRVSPKFIISALSLSGGKQ